MLSVKQCLMVQGTTSDAGKTVLVAGLCSVLARRGRSVAPFKPQNMALNSAVTVDGGEIGRAQALQAYACGIEAHTDMNPILLKPSSDTGAQVIVQGRALSSMEAESYHDYKKVAMSAVLDSFASLQKRYSSIIVEGAGSPAEINLREGDIANMGFAEEVDCPVILIADIDKGGVFAHLVGTLALLSQSEQDRVMGFVINRFRGERALLESGLDWLEERTGKPVLGVLPYLKDFYLDAEDAIDINQVNTGTEQIHIVVLVYSRISNHTDFDALRLHPQVKFTWLGPEQPMPSCDLIILPGSKNVRADLQHLKDWSWDQAIVRHLRYGGKVLGICGGYQMLGQSINDPLGVEQEAGLSQGLGLIPMQTILTEQKTLSCRSGHICLTHKPVECSGYEIHCGESEFLAEHQSLISYDTAEANSEGFISEDGQIVGTYLHGVFDRSQACMALLEWAGLNQVVKQDSIEERRNQQLERLADMLEDELDWSKLELY
ncbi:cobyric acid synthase [Agaribacterium sp. ZY112]|uniref:cobyric acid synthase n=1 Tax=Agaribacterium sp. ZY112 TaxID=3233574 RepID=UPI00352555F8